MMKKKSESKAGQSYKVFVSSTFCDNAQRRKVVQDAVTMAGMVWHGMEIFTAEKMPTKDACLKYAGEADLFVGIIARRYGWQPDGDLSITEMEYDAAKVAGKDCFMFQLDPNIPVNTESDFDDGADKWKKQEKLDAFKDRFAKDQLPAYFNETTLGAKVLAALSKWRQTREQVSVPEEVTSPVTGPQHDADTKHVEEIKAYCEKADALHAHLPVAGFVTQLTVPIDIEDIYVPLRAVLNLSGVDAMFADATHAEKDLRNKDACVEITLPEAFRQAQNRKRKGLVILGDPGSGKTTHLKRLLLGCLRKGAGELNLPSGMLPVFLPLRELRNLDHGLDAFIQEQLASTHLNTPQGFGERLLKRSNLLFLLDGLDEVADLKQREKVAGWIVDAITAHPNCRFVVTCRFAGYSPTVHLSGNFLEMHVRPFNSDEVERFVHNWYKAVEQGLAKDPDQAGVIAREKADRLLERLKESDFRTSKVFELTHNPLLLTNICLVHRHREDLPRKRAKLYEECIDVLLEYWRKAKKLRVRATAQERRRVLQPAALWLHGKDGRVRAKASELVPIIAPALKAIASDDLDALNFLKTIRDDSGLLTGWDQEYYGFMHLGFQEYLTAREIRNKAFKDKSILRELASHFGESWWQEVTLIMLALEDPSLFEGFMEEVVKLPAFAANPGLVDMCLEDAAETSVQPFVDILNEEPEKDEDLW